MPLSNMRCMIDAHLAESKVQSPHYYLTVDIQLDKVLRLRDLILHSVLGQTNLPKGLYGLTPTAASCPFLAFGNPRS